MKRWVTAVAVVLATSVLGGCIVEDRRYRHSRYEDDAWEVVRRDPCRYAEYRDYAREHKNPNKRRKYVEYLAREGCSPKYSRGGYYDDDRYYDDRRYRD